MSYDLYFGARNGKAPPSSEALVAFFEERAHYRAEGRYAVYENDGTGVRFVFDLDRETLDDDAEEGDDEPFEAIAAFNINYFRPHVFGLEAAPELAAFVRHFDLIVDDPQSEGMGRGEFTEDGFLRGWNAGNRFAFRVMVQQEPDLDVPTRPAAELEAVWRWNLERAVLQADHDELFVPRIYYLQRDDVLYTMATWTDAIPTVLPEVDLLMLGRAELAPRRLFGRDEDMAIIAWHELASLLEPFPRGEMPLPHRTIAYDHAPEPIRAFFQARWPAGLDAYAMVSADQILDRELLEGAGG